MILTGFPGMARFSPIVYQPLTSLNSVPPGELLPTLFKTVPHDTLRITFTSSFTGHTSHERDVG